LGEELEELLILSERNISYSSVGEIRLRGSSIYSYIVLVRVRGSKLLNKFSGKGSFFIKVIIRAGNGVGVGIAEEYRL
jgi:hypothetical protein